MAKIKYNVVLCKDCEQEFLLRMTNRKKYYCPTCGENLFTEKQSDIWLTRPIRYKRPWTQDEDELIKNCVRAGYSNQQISAELKGRTAKAINNRISRLRKYETIKRGRVNCKATALTGQK